MFLVLPCCSVFYLYPPSFPSLSPRDEVICRILAEKLPYRRTRTDSTPSAIAHASGTFELSNLSL